MIALCSATFRAQEVSDTKGTVRTTSKVLSGPYRVYAESRYKSLR